VAPRCYFKLPAAVQPKDAVVPAAQDLKRVAVQEDAVAPAM
jgi:hypothetical protein